MTAEGVTLIGSTDGWWPVALTILFDGAVLGALAIEIVTTGNGAGVTAWATEYVWMVACG